MMLFSTRPLTGRRRTDLARLGRASIVKTVHSASGCWTNRCFCCIRNESDLMPDQRRILETLRETDPTLFGKKVLVVDDDVRNIFALTSLLEDHNLNVLHAENGRAGIETARRRLRNIDLVLMDIMMPEMDGYETMKAIRQLPRFRSLPIDRADCQGDEGRPRQMHRGRSVRLHHQAGRSGAAFFGSAGMDHAAS
jgi:hypothetical protein